MGVDRKYGRVTTEHGNIGDDEPVVVFRGTDPNMTKLLRMYANLCRNSGSPPFHLEQIDAARMIIEGWQAQNPGKVRVPTSQSYADRMGHRE